MNGGIFTTKRRYIYLWLLIPVLFYIIFLIAPIILSAFYSLTNWKGGKGMRFTGITNYVKLSKDRDFLLSVQNNIWLMLLCLGGNTLLGYLLALLLSAKYLSLRKLYRFVLFLPVILSGVVVGYLWKMIYNEVPGLLNSLLNMMGLSGWTHLWLGDSKIAMTSICVIRIWKVIGMHLVVYLASLQNISTDVMEASEIDGATGIKRAWYVITPMMSGTLRVSLLLTITDSLKIFDIIYTTTKGGPANASSVMSFLTYRTAFEFFNFGYANAMAIASVLIGTAIVAVVNFVAHKGENQYGI